MFCAKQCGSYLVGSYTECQLRSRFPLDPLFIRSSSISLGVDSASSLYRSLRTQIDEHVAGEAGALTCPFVVFEDFLEYVRCLENALARDGQSVRLGVLKVLATVIELLQMRGCHFMPVFTGSGDKMTSELAQMGEFMSLIDLKVNYMDTRDVLSGLQAAIRAYGDVSVPKGVSEGTLDYLSVFAGKDTHSRVFVKVCSDSWRRMSRIHRGLTFDTFICKFGLTMFEDVNRQLSLEPGLKKLLKDLPAPEAQEIVDRFQSGKGLRRLSEPGRKFCEELGLLGFIVDRVVFGLSTRIPYLALCFLQGVIGLASEPTGDLMHALQLKRVGTTFCGIQYEFACALDLCVSGPGTVRNFLAEKYSLFSELGPNMSSRVATRLRKNYAAETLDSVVDRVEKEVDRLSGELTRVDAQAGLRVLDESRDAARPQDAMNASSPPVNASSPPVNVSSLPAMGGVPPPVQNRPMRGSGSARRHPTVEIPQETTANGSSISPSRWSPSRWSPSRWSPSRWFQNAFGTFSEMSKVRSGTTSVPRTGCMPGARFFPGWILRLFSPGLRSTTVKRKTSGSSQGDFATAVEPEEPTPQAPKSPWVYMPPRPNHNVCPEDPEPHAKTDICTRLRFEGDDGDSPVFGSFQCSVAEDCGSGKLEEVQKVTEPVNRSLMMRAGKHVADVRKEWISRANELGLESSLADDIKARPTDGSEDAFLGFVPGGINSDPLSYHGRAPFRDPHCLTALLAAGSSHESLTSLEKTPEQVRLELAQKKDTQLVATEKSELAKLSFALSKNLKKPYRADAVDHIQRKLRRVGHRNPLVDDVCCVSGGNANLDALYASLLSVNNPAVVPEVQEWVRVHSLTSAVLMSITTLSELEGAKYSGPCKVQVLEHIKAFVAKNEIRIGTCVFSHAHLRSALLIASTPRGDIEVLDDTLEDREQRGVHNLFEELLSESELARFCVRGRLILVAALRAVPTSGMMGTF